MGLEGVVLMSSGRARVVVVRNVREKRRSWVCVRF